MNAPLAFRLLLKLHAPRVVTAAYLALLDRDPDQQGLADYCRRLSESGDLRQIIQDIAQSEEAWNKAIFGQPARLIAATFRGMLGREPEVEAQTAYSEYLHIHRDLAGMLDDVGRSEEHWRRMVTLQAKSIVRAAFLALLKREPEPEALAVYSQELRLSADISALMSAIADSPEHWDVLLQTRRHTAKLLLSDDLPALLAEVVKSPKVWSELAELRFPHAGSARDAYDQSAWIFLHAQKTGGTSLQSMLTETFGDRAVFREHGNTVYRRSPAELAQYSVFAGHFDLDSIAFIPRRTRHLFTFLREPRQRLLSQYRFLRAHQPNSPTFDDGMVMANRLDAVDFFRSVMALAASAFWNHLTWCVMGQRRWKDYRQALSGLDEIASKNLLRDIRPEIRKQLQDFAFIGLLEDYTHSCQRLFDLIGTHVPHVRHHHSVELLSINARHFKYVPPRPLTPQLEEALAPLVQIDDIVYSEGCELYACRWSRNADGRPNRSV